MSDLSKNAAKKFRSLKRRPNMPEWYPVLQVGVAVIFTLFIGYQLISDVDHNESAAPTINTAVPGDGGGGGVIIGPDGPVTAPETPDSVNETAAPNSTDPTDPPSPDTEPDATTPSTSPATSPTTTQVAIADDAVALPGPNNTTVAVPIAALDRAKAVAKAATSDTAVLSDERVAFSSETRYSIAMNIDPDGDGPQPVDAIVVTVTLDNGNWTGSL